MFKEFMRAFAVNSHVAAPPEEQLQLVELLAGEIVRRRMTTPALMFLEMSRPLNFLGAQAMHFFTPILSSVFDAQAYETFAKFLERRDSIDIISERIETLERAAQQRDSNPS